MERLPSWIRQHLAALRVLLALTLVTGAIYPLVVTGVAQALFNGNANGSMVQKDGKDVGSGVIGQYFTDADGNPVKKYFQSRPSAAGAGYDPTSSAASNLGPENIVDTLPVPGAKDAEGIPTRASRACSPRCAPAARRSASWRASAAPGRTARPTGWARC